MTLFQMENFFANSSFLFLFLSMICYWVQLAFPIKNWKIGNIFMGIANFSLLSLLILRWKESGHFPLSNLYESLMFLSWSLSTFHLFLENIESGISNKNISKQRFSFLGSFTSPTALFINAFATFRLPLEMQQSSPLVPALQSNWLMMHVTVMILSYSALICGSLLSIAFLVVSKNLQFEFSPEAEERGMLQISASTFPNKENSLSNTESSSQIPQEQISLSSVSEAKRTFAENLDNLSYRILGIGFPLLTIGILSGAVWANEAWGSYWSWDPKETWALATWLVFAIYLHLRISKGWRGKKPAILASAGFVTVWICFLGVNLLGEGLHSYGFFKDSL